jgi:hypothetical protein
LPHGTAPDDACAYDYLSCGETAVGVTRGFPTLRSDPTLAAQAPDRYYLVTLWHPATLAASTCNPRTSGFPLTLALYDAPPNSPNVTLLATQAPHTPTNCGLLFYRALRPMTVYLTLDGLHPDASNDDDDAYDDDGEWIGDQDGSGFFELSLACEDLSGPALEDSCGYDYLECGDVKQGTTVGRPDFVGADGRGDALHAFTVWEPTQITLSTCAEGTAFPARVLVFAGDPRGFDPSAGSAADGDASDDFDQGGGRRDDDEASTAGSSPWGRGVRLLAATDPAEARREGCGSATVALSAPGSYFAVVTSAAAGRFPSQREGVYHLAMTCDPLFPGGANPEATCPTSFVECGDVVLGHTLGFPSWGGDPALSDRVYALTVWEPTTLAASTCSSQTDFATTLALYGGWPQRNGSNVVAATVRGSPCGFLVVELTVPGTYFLLVEGLLRGGDGDDGASGTLVGNGATAGVFELSLLCLDLGAPALNDTCAYR